MGRGSGRKGHKASARYKTGAGDVRARIEGGIDIFSDGGVRASISGFHDGIGAKDFGNTGVHIGLSFGF